MYGYTCTLYGYWYTMSKQSDKIPRIDIQDVRSPISISDIDLPYPDDELSHCEQSLWLS